MSIKTADSTSPANPTDSAGPANRGGLAGLGLALAATPRWLQYLLLFFSGAVVFGYVSQELFWGIPHLDDSVAALYQAQVLLAGNLVWPVAEEIKPFFDLFGIVTPLGKPGYWAAMYPPGWPLLLSVGLAAGAPWLVNPLLGGLLAVVVAVLARTLYGAGTGLLAGVLTVCSPFVGVISASHLSHTSSALFCALAWLAAVRLLRSSGTVWGVVGGAALGMALLIRPVTAVLVGVILAVVVLLRYQHARAAWRGLLSAMALLLLAGGALLSYQGITTGDPLTPGHVVEMGAAAKLGMGPVADSAKIHTPAKAWRHTLERLKVLDRHLLGWPLPAWLFCLAPFLLRRAGLEETAMLAVPLVLLGLFALFWYREEWFPGRYVFAAVPLLLVLAARGFLCWWELLRHRRLAWLPPLLLLVSLGYAVGIHTPDYHRGFGPNHGDVEKYLPQVVTAYDISNAIVFMNSTGRLPSGKRNDYYATGFRLNDLNLQGDVLFARDARHPTVTQANEFLITRYPGRSYYYYQFDQNEMKPRLYRYLVREGRITGRRPITPVNDLLLPDDSGA